MIYTNYYYSFKIPIIIILLTHVFSLYAFSNEIDEKEIIAYIDIKIINAPGDSKKIEKIAKDLINLRVGDIFSEKRLKESIDTLSDSKKFAQIHIDSKVKHGYITLFFRLTPNRHIKDIKISGEFPFFEREILNVMTVYPGDILIEKEIEKQSEYIVNFLQREGFIDPDVKVSSWQDPGDKYYILYVKIKKGGYFRLDKVNIEGNRAFSKIWLKSKLNCFRHSLLPGTSGCFKDKILKNDLNYLKKYYWSKGYVNAEINYKLEKNRATKTVTVSIFIREGPYYQINFIGNRHFSKKRLYNEIVIFNTGNEFDIGIKKSIRHISNLYKNAGYLDVNIELKDMLEIHGEDCIQKIWLSINEGPRTIIKSINIAGNKKIGINEIKGQMLLSPGLFEKGVLNTKILEEDISAIKSFYLRRGFLDMFIKSSLNFSKDRQLVDINIHINEGKQIFISSLKIAPDLGSLTKKAYEIIHLKKGLPFRKYMIESDKNALCALIAENGYPYVQIKEEYTYNDDRDSVSIIYNIDKGIVVNLNQIFFKGNFRTKERELQNEMLMKKGELFSLKKALKAQRNIRNMKIFNSVKFEITGLKKKSDKINIMVDLEEKKSHYFEFGGGYESEKGGFGNLKIGDNNIFGKNKEAWAGFNISQTGNRSEFGLIEPNLFNKRISTAFGYYNERKAEFNKKFGTKINGWSLGFTRDIKQSLCLRLNFKYERRDQFLRELHFDELDLYEIIEFKPRSIFVSTPSLTFDTRDSFIKPQKGIFTFFSADISRGIDNSLDNFIKYRFDFRYYYKPFKYLTLASIARMNYIHPYGKEGKIPDDQLFFLGGTADIRGFPENMLLSDGQENPMGGKSSTSGSIEARFDLGLNFELVLFYDAGTVKRPFDETAIINLRTSTGGGFRYITPIGPIGFLYGIKLDKLEYEDTGRLHFSLGYTF